ncbi:MAG TPA: hypothetical protein VM687_10470 [Stenotrophomonas sp.]|nr:hypothetical protein [Stenotrophomonas sp.]
MERKLFSRRTVFLFLALLAFAAIAKTININAGAYPYNTVPAAQGISVSDDSTLRMAALTALTGMYRTISGVASVSIGDVIAVTYDDGSKEQGNVVCMAGSVCVMPVPGTQQGANDGGGTAGGGGGGEGSGGGGSGNGGGGSGGNLGECPGPACTVSVG